MTNINETVEPTVAEVFLHLDSFVKNPGETIKNSPETIQFLKGMNYISPLTTEVSLLGDLLDGKKSNSITIESYIMTDSGYNIYKQLGGKL